MSSSLRVLKPEELGCVAGGSMDPWGWPDYYYTTQIVVTGYLDPWANYNPWVQSMSYAYYMDNYYQDPYVQMYAYDTGGGTGGSPTSNYPSNFDHQLDNTVDTVASAVAAEIAGKSDVGEREYGAVLWKDANGNVHSTSVKPGTGGPAASWDPATVWSEIPFANGATVIGIIHSHPHVNTGTNGDTISGQDFDRLMGVYNQSPGYQTGYDNTNFRDYLVYNGTVNEYYGFDQNPAYIGSGAQATWAVESTDYGN